MRRPLAAVFILFSLYTMNAQVLFDSKKPSQDHEWYVLDDVVMGGRSLGNFEQTSKGHIHYSGTISLANNGGFSSLRFAFPPTSVTPESVLRIYLKGDGSKWQLRVKQNKRNSYSYTTYFTSNKQWEYVEIRLKDLYPVYRGRRLDSSNFNHNSLEEIIFLIGNKKVQNFELDIEKIELIQ